MGNESNPPGRRDTVDPGSGPVRRLRRAADPAEGRGAARPVAGHPCCQYGAAGVVWTIGRAILDRQASEGWGARVVDRLAGDLRPTKINLSATHDHGAGCAADAAPPTPSGLPARTLTP